MTKKLIAIVISLLVACALCITGCKSEQDSSTETDIAEIQRGDILVSVVSDGTLVMPRVFELRFGTTGTVKEVLVEEGDRVRAGTLLAKLDDTSQLIAVEQALLDLQITLSDLVETVPGMHQVLGLYRSYPHTSALTNFELAQQEIINARAFLEQGKYKEALGELKIADYDMTTCITILEAPLSDPETYPDITGWTDVYTVEHEVQSLEEIYPKIPQAISAVEKERANAKSIYNMIDTGNYTRALTGLNEAQKSVFESRIKVLYAIGVITTQTMTYPDILTGLDFFESAQDILQELQQGIETGTYSEEDIALALRIAEHDMNTSNAILKRNVWEAEHGLSLKDTRTYKLSLKKYQASLRDAREEYMKTEILAPFDGTVVDIGVSEDDQLSSQDYSSKTAVKIVDTEAIQFEGVVDEIDIFSVEVGQKATIVVDALPDEEFTGTVLFISPSGTTETGVVNYAVTIVLDPTDVELKGSLTATADIILEDKKDVLLLPVDAIIETSGGKFVDLWNEDTMKTQRRQVTVGTQTYQFAEVLTGLEEGDKVVIGEQGL
jgi:RND family efflux transporter MFP subunit